MSNYTVITDWDGKDALADSNPAKVISGDEFQDEFDAIATAVATKADINGNAAESFSALTASSGTNTTQVATTAFVTTAIDNIPSSYPVGSVFLTVTNYADSAAVVAAIGGTTWVRFGEGRMMVGYSTTDSDFGTVQGTGGSKTHTLTTDEIPSHTHDITFNAQGDGFGGTPAMSIVSGGSSRATESTGGGQAHNNLPPYIVTYMWKRTA